MCMIIYKPSNASRPLKRKFKECFKSNSDGAGFMYRETIHDLIKIKKGYMNFRSLWKDWQKFVENDFEAVVHFRFGTSGEITPENCHPFPITDNEFDITILDLFTDFAMAHNGIITGFIDHNSPYSDTQLFILKGLSHPIIVNNWRKLTVKAYIKTKITTDRMIFFKTGEKATMFGDWIEKKGLFYSSVNFSWATVGITRTNSDTSKYRNSSYWDWDEYYNGY